MELFLTKANAERHSIKYKLPCQDNSNATESWLTISKLLSYTDGNVGVLQGTLARLVVKFGDLAEITTEYDVAQRLYDGGLVNFIKFICVFKCKDDFQEVLKRNYVARPHICQGKGVIGCIVMPHYAMGSLGTYFWTKEHVGEFKNVLKQVCFALCVAFETLGFVHMDLHASNVLIRDSKKQSIDYGHMKLPIIGRKYAMIMDLQNYCLRDEARFVGSLERIIYTACVSDGSDLMLDFDTRAIRAWRSAHATFSTKAFADLAQIIDNIPLRYVKSERPVFKW